jgi:diketogulonate reductase-like aldo/keto reductase
VSIPGTTKLHRLEENLKVAVVELITQDMERIVEARPRIAVEGEWFHSLGCTGGK